MKNLIVKFFEAVTGKTREQLAFEYSVHLFVTRSPLRAYWRTLAN